MWLICTTCISVSPLPPSRPRRPPFPLTHPPDKNRFFLRKKKLVRDYAIHMSCRSCGRWSQANRCLKHVSSWSVSISTIHHPQALECSVFCDSDEAELGMTHVKTRLDARLVGFDRCFGAQLHALLQTSAGAGRWCWWRRWRRWCPRPTRHG
jgi:hypothetical protein